jgi:hypothetical protein
MSFHRISSHARLHNEHGADDQEHLIHHHSAPIQSSSAVSNSPIPLRSQSANDAQPRNANLTHTPQTQDEKDLEKALVYLEINQIRNKEYERHLYELYSLGRITKYNLENGLKEFNENHQKNSNFKKNFITPKLQQRTETNSIEITQRAFVITQEYRLLSETLDGKSPSSVLPPHLQELRQQMRQNPNQ